MIATASEAETEYLDQIVACSNGSSTTYLMNGSDAVWELQSTGGAPGAASFTNETTEMASFRYLFTDPALLVPGAEVYVNLAPADVEWDIDLALSAAWQGHEQVADMIKNYGEDVLQTALTSRTSPAGAALAKCTLSVFSAARDDIQTAGKDAAELTEAVSSGLSSTVAARTCYSAARQFHAPSPNGEEAEALSSRIEAFDHDTEAVESVHLKLEGAQRVARATDYVLQFLDRR